MRWWWWIKCGGGNHPVEDWSVNRGIVWKILWVVELVGWGQISLNGGLKSIKNVCQKWNKLEEFEPNVRFSMVSDK